MKSDIDKQLVDAAKLGFEYFKHLTTLSTGAIVLLGTLLGSRLDTLAWKSLLLHISYGSFFLCVLASVAAMWSMVHLSVPGPRSQEDLIADKVLVMGSSISAATFVLAVLCSAGVVVLNV